MAMTRRHRRSAGDGRRGRVGRGRGRRRGGRGGCWAGRVVGVCDNAGASARGAGYHGGGRREPPARTTGGPAPAAHWNASWQRGARPSVVQLEVPTMDLPTLRRMLLKLEKGISKNQQLRIKYAGDPDKYAGLRVPPAAVVPCSPHVDGRCGLPSGGVSGSWSRRWTWTRT